MSMIQSDLLLGQEGGAGYTISRSLRFNSSDSAFLSRTPASAGNQTTMTFSFWMKLGRLGINRRIYCGGSTAWNDGVIQVSNSDKLDLILNNGSSQAARLTSTRVFRDPSAWYHVVVNYDSTNGTSTDRWRMYVNNERITVFDSASYPGSSVVWRGVNSTDTQFIGTGWDGLPFDGYLAEFYFINGQALNPSSFVETSATTGQLIPKAYTGSFGTNGFWLKFSDNSAATATTLGKDYSGNNNNWTPNNVSVITGGPTSVAAASGALPIYNTTDTYGATKGTGTRTDSNSSSIVLAIPMDGANNGTTFTDESATIKGSGSSKSITPSTTVTSTTRSKYYGSSGYFNGASSSLGVGSSADFSFGTGDFTAECWVYLNSQGGGGYNHYFSIQTQNTFALKSWSGGFYLYANSGTVVTTSSTPPLNKWTHLALVRNGSTLTIYVDGIASGTASTSASFGANASATIGTAGGTSGEFLDGYMQDLRVYKGVAKYTSNFNPPTPASPTIAAGNDSLVDTPTSGSQVDTGLGGQVTGNYCTLNPLVLGSTTTLLNGNLQANYSGWNSSLGTIAVSSGKWFYEVSVVSTESIIGFAKVDSLINNAVNTYFTAGSTSYGYYVGGSKHTGPGNSSTSYGASYTTGDVIGVALDLDAGTLTFYKNGSSQGVAFSSLSGLFIPVLGSTGQPTGEGLYPNFGQRPWAYAAPAGFKALCDTNLPAPVVAKSSTVFQAVTYTGNSSYPRTISGLNFSPDLIWTKIRSQSYRHMVADVVRGTANSLTTNNTNAESLSDAYGWVSAFNSDGWSIQSGSVSGENFNQSGESYVAWTWDAGTSTVTNTQGSITSQVRANASAGFSIVTYTGNLSSPGVSTVGHGLGIAPSMVITKRRDGASDWCVQHISTSSASQILFLNTTDAQFNTSSYGTLSRPSSTAFSVNQVTGMGLNAQTHVAYCFAPVAGYSAMGSYVGNGAQPEGPMITTMFKPRWVLIKSTSSADDWVIFDTARNAYNVTNTWLRPNDASAEITDTVGTVDVIDIVSNGFKVRGGDTRVNGSGYTYIYFAVAESPFAYSRAR